MIPKNNLSAGSDSVQAVGENVDIDVIHYHAVVPEMKRSHLFEVCTLIIEADIPISEADEYNLSLPSGWDDKLDYNKVERYADIFKAEVDAYDVVEEIMREFPNRAKLIQYIRHMYLLTEAKTDSGDEILDKVFDKILDLVEAGQDPANEGLHAEDKARAIRLLMFYAITKCQLLKRIPA